MMPISVMCTSLFESFTKSVNECNSVVELQTILSSTDTQYIKQELQVEIELIQCNIAELSTEQFVQASQRVAEIQEVIDFINQPLDDEDVFQPSDAYTQIFGSTGGMEEVLKAIINSTQPNKSPELEIQKVIDFLFRAL